MISSFQLKSVAAAVDYHADAFDNAKPREGAAGEQTSATWGGTGAELAGLGIGAQVAEQSFRSVLEGKVDAQQIQGGFSREQGAGFHKPGMDFTFSPGKSISAVALVGGDERLFAAHGAAVETAIRFLEERGSLARVGGEQQHTGNLLYAKFEHITSRQQDPQMHTHVVIANATQDKAGKWRALDNSELLNLRKEADQIYGKALDGHLKNLGYKTEQGKSGPEIAGFQPEQLKAFSVRRDDIERHLSAQGLTLETASTDQKQVANLATRPDKAALPREQLQEMWREKAAAVGLDITRMSAQKPEPAKVQVREAASAAVDHAVASLVSQSQAIATKFDGFREKALTAASPLARESAFQGMQSAANALKPQTVSQYRTEFAAQGLKNVSSSQVEKALDTAVTAGTMEKLDGKYAPVAAKAGDREHQVIDTAVAVVRSDLVQAGNRFESALKAFQEGPADAGSRGVQAVADAYKDAQAVTGAQVGRAVRGLGLKFAKGEQVDAALSRAVSAGTLAAKDGKFAVNMAASERRDDAMVHAAVSGVIADWRSEGTKFDRLAEQFAEHAARPTSEQNTKAMTGLATELKQASYAQGPKSAAQIGFSVREAGLQFVNNERIQATLVKAVGSGELHAAGDKFTVNPAESERRGGVAKNALAQVDGVDVAVSRVVERMNQARDDLPHLQQELLSAARADLKKLPEYFKEHQAQQRSAGKAVADTDRAANRPPVSGRVKTLVARIDAAEKMVSLTPAQMRSEVRAELGNLQSGQSLQKALNSPMAPENHTLGGSTKVLVSNDSLNAAIARAIPAGQLHINVDKLSAETVEQTDNRKAAFTQSRAALQKEDRTVSNFVKTTVKAGILKDKHIENKASYLAKREAKVTSLPADLQAKARTAQKGQTAKNVVRSTKAISRTISQLKRSPVKTATKLVAGGAAKLAYAIYLTGARQGWQIEKAAFKTVTAGAKGLVLAASKTHGDAFTRKVTEQNGKLKGNLELALYGYQVDSRGDTRRATLSVANVTLSAAVGVMTVLHVHRFTGGMAMRNALLEGITSKKVNSAEALVARGVMAGAKRVQGQIKTQQTKLGYGRHSEKLAPVHEQQKAAYSKFVAAAVAHGKGELSGAGLQEAKAGLLSSSAKLEQVLGKAMAGARSEMVAGRMFAKDYEKVYTTHKNLVQGMADIKQLGRVSLAQKEAITGDSARGINQLEAKAGSVDKLGLHVKYEAPLPWDKAEVAKQTAATAGQIKQASARAPEKSAENRNTPEARKTRDHSPGR